MKNKTLMKTLSALLAVVMVLCSAPLSGFVGLKFPELKLTEWNLFDYGVEADAASASISAYSSKTNVTSGDTVTITISLNSNPGVFGLNFTLSYNSAHLQYVSSEIGSAGNTFSLKNANQSGSSFKGAFMNVDSSACFVTGTLATITFKVVSVVSATSPMSLSASATDVDENQVSVSASGTTLKITPSVSEPESIISSIEVEDVVLIENCNGYHAGYWDEEAGEYIENAWFEYWITPQNIKIIYKDGTVVVGNDSEIYEQTGEWISCSSDQSYANQWAIGEHFATIEFMGMTVEYKVIITASPIQSIEVDDVILIERFNGWYDGYYDGFLDEYFENTWFCYSIEPENIKITYKDGTIIAGNQDEIYDQTDEWVHCLSDQSYENQWDIGEHTATIEFLGVTAEYKVIIEESPVENIYVGDITLIENYDGSSTGYYDENGDYIENSWFEYWITPQDIRIIYKDGTLVSGTESEIYEQTGEWISIHTDQSYENQWGVGEYTVTADFMGIRTEFGVTIVENPVLAVFVEDVEIAEYTNGYYNNWNDIIGENTDDEWYCYTASPQKATIVFKDGTIITGNQDEIYDQTDEWVYYLSDQSYENQWSVGEHTAAIEYMGCTAEFKVTITETPVASVTAEYRGELYEYVDGYFREDEEGSEYFDYMLNDELLYITINYKDGSYETVTLAEMYYNSYSNIADFIIENNQSYKNEWGVGRHIVNLKVAGETAIFYVYVIENPYVDIEISGTDNLQIILTKENGEKEKFEALAFNFFYIDENDVSGYIITDKGQFKCSFNFDSYDKNLKLHMLGCISNTLNECTWLKLWVYALEYLSAAVGYNMSRNIAMDYHGDIIKDNIDDLAWIVMTAQSGLYNDEYVQWQDDSSVAYNANYVLTLMQNVFDVTLEDLKKSNNYNTENNTITFKWRVYGFDSLRGIYVNSSECGYCVEMQIPSWLAESNEELNDKFIIKFDKNFIIQEFYRMSPDENRVNSVKAPDISVSYNGTTKIEPDVKYVGDIDYTFEYSSSNESVATVDKDGNVTATGTGEAEITVTVTDEYGNIVEDTSKVTVSYAWWQWLIIIFLFGWIWY